ncbi:M48 family metalloprotease [Thiovibrio frasassiensis]|jgi:predicted Zn-dependent protease|uniref:M48 family metalloprotease n=1 Tax=Thiovibrio frasassiensis TaxID=2984131 RepID=A0A9X4RMG3_9BACT|nr:M48 family metalloprotease [Thiovibrio frasassiensis]MDG4476153.1 M48 family metalloprotease [Thiovibrio frasassiensis]
MRRIQWLILSVLVLVQPLILSCAVNPVTGKSELAFYSLSEQEEVSLGKKAFPEAIQQMQGEYEDQHLKKYVTAVGMRLVKTSHRPNLPYAFKIVNDSSPNAFAMPGGNIAITRGLLVALESEGQLAAVLGHELGHVTARHSVQNLQRGMLLNMGMLVLSASSSGTSYSGAAQQAGQLAGSILSSSYSREQEREADRLGIDYMVNAQYSPKGAVELQEFLAKKSGEGEAQWLQGLFRTHPFSQERMRDNQYYIDSKYSWAMNNEAYASGEGDFKRAMASLMKTSAAYSDYDKGRVKEQAKDLPGAIALYGQAVHKAPEQALLQNALGMAHLKNNSLADAKKYLTKAVQLDAEYFESHFGLGVLYLKENNPALAKEHLQKSMKLMPTLGSAFFLAESYEKTGELAKAQTLYGQVAAADSRGNLGRAAAARYRALGGARR